MSAPGRRQNFSVATRNGDIEITSNDFAWDTSEPIGTLVKQGAEQSPLQHLPVWHVYLGGYSQSGVDIQLSQ